jgi:hypothetical protein
LKNIRREKYECELCVAAHEITLDEMVEVSFTVAPRVRRIPAHDPETLPNWGSAFHHPGCLQRKGSTQ